MLPYENYFFCHQTLLRDEFSNLNHSMMPVISPYSLCLDDQMVESLFGSYPSQLLLNKQNV